MVPIGREGGAAAFAAAVMTVASVVALGWLEARPRDPHEVAAVFAPWTAPEDAFHRATAAGGRVVRQGASAAILVVRGEAPGLIERLYAGGAWMVLDPAAFGGCLVRPEGQAS